MNRKNITVQFDKKIQIEQYEPETIGVEQTVEIEDDDDVDEVRDQLHRENVAFVGREITARLAAKRMEDARNED